MADIELGDYLSEIAEMLAAEKNDEAVAHCRHILDYYPKNLAAYQFLGKGLLEQRRFHDAADILYRVLSVAPDDFVAHVGLAIIGEEEENLAQSVGHMARAFDTQPNNGAIQSELKRLYGRRDGVEPARIRLTQGALARLYIRGGNYGQAVEELQNALKDTPERIDLKVLLARALWKDEQRIDAVEVCQEVLERLPYCLEANQILYEIWQSAGRDDEAIAYWQRVEALDPYLAFKIKDKSLDEPAPQLPIPLLDYVPPTPEEIMGVPDWVQDLGLDRTQPGVPSQAKVAPADADEEAVFGSDIFPADTADEEAESVPDWLREMGPEEEAGTAVADEPEISWGDSPQVQDEEALGEMVPDWLRDGASLEETEEEGAEPVIEFDAPEMPSSEEISPEPDSEEFEELPDWLSSAVDWTDEKAVDSSVKKNEQEEDDWLPDLTLSLAAEEAEQAESPAEPPDTQEPAIVLDMADTQDQEEMPDWLQAVQVDEETGQVGVETEPEPASPPDFNWDQLEDALTPTEQETPPESSGESFPPALSENEDFPFDWASETAEPSAIDEDTMVPAAETQADSTPTLITEEESVMANSDKEFDITGDNDEMGEMPSDTEDALAWLEQLAAKQGAPREELPSLQGQAEDEIAPADDIPDWLKELAPPAEEPAPADQPEQDEIPEWLAADDTQPSSPPALEPAVASSEPETELDDISDIPDWLKETAEPSPAPHPSQFEPTRPLSQAGEADIPDWLKGELQPDEAQELDAELAGIGADIGDMPADPDEAMAWLEELAADEGAPLEELPTQSAELEPQEAELPSWLTEETEPTPAPETPTQEVTPTAEQTDIPEWLQDMTAPTEEEAQAAPPVAETAVPEEVAEVPEDMDEAMAWLEQLAARQGAPLDELPSVSDAEETLVAEKPTWLEEEAAAAPEPELATAAAEEVDLPDWLKEDAGEPLPAEEAPEPAAAETAMELPEWLEEPETPEVEEAPEPVSAEVAEPEMPAWLQEEAPEPQPSEDLPEWLEETPEEETVQAEPEPVALEEPELPEWLQEQETEAEEVQADVEAPVLEEPELPEWLREETPEPEPAEAVLETEDLEEPELPEWLKEEAPTPVEAEVETVATEEPEPAEIETEPEAVEAVTEPELSVEPEAEISEPVGEEPAVTELVEPEIEPEQPKPAPVEEEKVEEAAVVAEEEPALEAPVTGIKALREQIEASPGDHVTRLALARALMDDQNLGESLAEYQELVAAGQELEEIAQDLQVCVKEQPANTLARRLLGDAYMKQGELDQALNAYRQALEHI